MKKKLLIGTNTKMYKTISDTEVFITRLDELTKDISREDMELFVIPSFTAIEKAKQCISDQSIKIGAQNMNWEDQGQFTGEISPLMLKEIGADIVEIGHSERRHILGETDFEINKKVTAAIHHGFIALLCIGETLEQKKYNISNEILRMQLKIALDGVTKESVSQLWVAYEPVWAIGVDGIPATSGYADEKHKIIKDTLQELFGDHAIKIPVLYGGSVNPGNANELITEEHIDGLFVGRSAWDADKFNDLIRQIMPLI